ITPLLIMHQAVLLHHRATGQTRRVGVTNGLPLAWVGEDPLATNSFLYKAFGSAAPTLVEDGRGLFYHVPGRTPSPLSASALIRDLIVYLDLVQQATNLAATAVHRPKNPRSFPTEFLDRKRVVSGKAGVERAC